MDKWNGPQPSRYERAEWKRTAGEPALNQLRGEVESAYEDQAKREAEYSEKGLGGTAEYTTFADNLLLRALEMKDAIFDWATDYATGMQDVVAPFKQEDETAGTFESGVDRFASTADRLDDVMSRIQNAINDAINVTITVRRDGSVLATVGGGSYNGIG